MNAKLRRAAGHLLVELYPLGWRRRYGDELHALIDDDPPSVRRATTLLYGAAAAHLSPRSRLDSPPEVRMRLSVTAVFMCWMAVSVAGAGFQKEIEDQRFGSAAHAHPLLAVARDVVIAGAIVGVIAIALGGLPLLAHALAVARRRRDRRLAALLALPATAAGGFALLTLAAVAITGRSGPRDSGLIAVAFAWQAAGVVCVALCALAPRLVLARIEPPSWMLRLAAVASVPLASAMIGVTLGLAGYDVELCLRAPELAAQSGFGPSPTTGVALAFAAAVAAVSSALALLAAMRARRAAALTLT